MDIKKAENKLIKLKNIIEDFGKVVVGFSGGVDSSFLAKICYDVLGENAMGVTADTQFYPYEKIKRAKEIANEIGITHKILKINAINEEVHKNPSDRCYYCKYTIFSKLKEISPESVVVDGTIIDDMDSFRPGMKAIKELKIKSPLKDVEINKEEIRYFSKKLNLSTWSDNSYTCLATRFPYGEKISKDKLKMVEEAENILKKYSFKNLRVRHHGEIARIEVNPDQRDVFFDKKIMDKINEEIKDIGFNYITLDLEGYRSGSMDEVL